MPKSIDDLLASLACKAAVKAGDKLYSTGKEVKVSGMVIHQVAGGQFKESWECVDTLSLLQQLGLAPALGGSHSVFRLFARGASDYLHDQCD